MFQTILDNAMQKATQNARTAFRVEMIMAGRSTPAQMAEARAKRNAANATVSRVRAYRIARLGRQ